MMDRLIKFTTIIFLFTCIFSCIKDDSELYVNDIGTAAIVLEDFYNAYSGEQLVISPEIDLSGMKESDLKYVWAVKKGSKYDTLSTERDLDIIAPTNLIGNFSFKFEIIDDKTDVRYTQYSNIKFTTPFNSGWILLSDLNNQGYLSFVSEAKEGFTFKDIYQYAEGKVMPKGRHLDVAYGDNPLFGVILEEEPEKSFYMDANTYTSYYSTISKAFYNFDYVEGEFAPLDILLGYGTGTYSPCQMLIMNNKVYPKQTAAEVYGFFHLPVDGDYKADEYAAMFGYANLFFGFYDMKNKRYMLVDGGDPFVPLFFDTPDSPVDLGNVDGDVLWMGGSFPLNYSSGQFLSIVRTPLGKEELHTFNIEKEYVQDSGGEFIINYNPVDIRKFVFQDGFVNENTVFAATNNKLYIAKGKDVYVLNVAVFGGGNLGTPLFSMDHDITCMKLSTANTLAIATNNPAATDGFTGNFYIVGLTGENIGEKFVTAENIGGYIKDMASVDRRTSISYP